ERGSRNRARSKPGANYDRKILSTLAKFARVGRREDERRLVQSAFTERALNSIDPASSYPKTGFALFGNVF
ncbi:MAG TPA: hypothetical protein VMJ31_01310, partial [Methylocystis sp.]|nr:hypothetical protein [Methylocystis sp.]